MIATVGGTPAPIIHTISQLKPERVAFICSADTRPLCDDIAEKCALDVTKVTLLILTNPELLGTCYEEIRGFFREIVPQWNIPVENIHIDYTGGTKTMSAAVVLAAAERFSNFSYVGGDARSKEGVGVVLDGKEKRHIQSNPWDKLAVREMERAGTLWNNQQYAACAKLMEEITRRVPIDFRKPYKTMQIVAEGLAARRAFNLHPLAKDRMHRACDNLKECNDSTKPLMEFCQCARERFLAFGRCRDNKASIADYQMVLSELLDNALLTARTQRYEDACARLYRFMELQAQVWLWEKTDGAFHLGKLLEGKPLPDELLSMPSVRYLEAGQSPMFSLEAGYRALSHLGHEKVQRIVSDFRQNTIWSNATAMRNGSVLAHGLDAVTGKRFTQYLEAVQYYLGADTSKPSLEPPMWNPNWFISNK